MTLFGSFESDAHLQVDWVKPAWAFAVSLHGNKGRNLSRCLFLANPANDLESRAASKSRNHHVVLMNVGDVGLS